MSRRRGRKLMGEINVVPYIDVTLVLLIIFMVTAIEPDDLEPLLLSVDAAGAMYLNLGDPGQALPPARLLELAGAALRREPKRPVLVKADKAVPYGRVVEGMVLLQQAGARKVGFVTEPLPPQRSGGQR
jgi:biopolymer transport protein TolR